jgi:hypothetical protein
MASALLLRCRYLGGAPPHGQPRMRTAARPFFGKLSIWISLVYPFKQDPYQVGAEKFRFARRKLQNISKADTSLL